MEKDLNKQILSVRKQIHNAFNSASCTASPLLSPKEELQNPKTISKAYNRPKPKEYLSLPSISVHRNPMSLISQKDMVKHKIFTKKKKIWKGTYGYKLNPSPENELDWDKIIFTCTDLLKNRY
jgi:hypothetical protein